MRTGGEHGGGHEAVTAGMSAAAAARRRKSESEHDRAVHRAKGYDAPPAFELGWEHEADGLGPWEWCGDALEEFDILMQIGYDVTNVAEQLAPTNPRIRRKLDAPVTEYHLRSLDARTAAYRRRFYYARAFFRARIRRLEFSWKGAGTEEVVDLAFFPRVDEAASLTPALRARFVDELDVLAPADEKKREFIAMGQYLVDEMVWLHELPKRSAALGALHRNYDALRLRPRDQTDALAVVRRRRGRRARRGPHRRVRRARRARVLLVAALLCAVGASYGAFGAAVPWPVAATATSARARADQPALRRAAARVRVRPVRQLRDARLAQRPRQRRPHARPRQVQVQRRRRAATATAAPSWSRRCSPRPPRSTRAASSTGCARARRSPRCAASARSSSASAVAQLRAAQRSARPSRRPAAPRRRRRRCAQGRRAALEHGALLLVPVLRLVRRHVRGSGEVSGGAVSVSVGASRVRACPARRSTSTRSRRTTRTTRTRAATTPRPRRGRPRAAARGGSGAAAAAPRRPAETRRQRDARSAGARLFAHYGDPAPLLPWLGGLVLYALFGGVVAYRSGRRRAAGAWWRFGSRCSPCHSRRCSRAASSPRRIASRLYFCSAYACVTEPHTACLAGALVFSLLAQWRFYYGCLLLLDLVALQPRLRRIVRALAEHALVDLLLIFVVLVVAVFILSAHALYFFGPSIRADPPLEGTWASGRGTAVTDADGAMTVSVDLGVETVGACPNLFYCFVNALDVGVRTGDLSGAAMAPLAWEDGTSYGEGGASFADRTVFGVAFFLVVGVVFFDLCLGVVADAFSRLREREHAREKALRHTSFVADIDRHEYERRGPAYKFDRLDGEQPWESYVLYIAYLRQKKPTGTGARARIARNSRATPRAGSRRRSACRCRTPRPRPRSRRATRSTARRSRRSRRGARPRPDRPRPRSQGHKMMVVGIPGRAGWGGGGVGGLEAGLMPETRSTCAMSDFVVPGRRAGRHGRGAGSATARLSESQAAVSLGQGNDTKSNDVSPTR